MPKLLPAIVSVFTLSIIESWIDAASPDDDGALLDVLALPPGAGSWIALIVVVAFAVWGGWRVSRARRRGDFVAADEIDGKIERRAPYLVAIALLVAEACSRDLSSLWCALPPSWPILPRSILAVLQALAVSFVTVVVRPRGQRRVRASVFGRAGVLLLGAYLGLTGLVDLMVYVPSFSEAIALDPFLGALTLLVLVLLIAGVAPIAARYLWPARRLASGALRDRLVAVSERARVRFRDIYVWNTGEQDLINASVSGPLPVARSFFLTDGLLARIPDDGLAAVFAHELGHVARRHFHTYLALVLALVFLLLASDATFVVWHRQPSLAFVFEWYVQLPVGLAVLAVTIVTFSRLSRLLEYDADLYGAKLTSPTVYADTLASVGTLSGSLERKASLRHPAILDRIALILGSSDRPELAQRVRHRVGRVRRAVLLSLLVSAGLFTVVAVLQETRPAVEREFERATYLLSLYEHRVHGGDTSRYARELLPRAKRALQAAERAAPEDSDWLERLAKLGEDIAEFDRER